MDSGEGGRVSPKRSGMVVTGHPPPTGKDRLKDKGNSTQKGSKGEEWAILLKSEGGRQKKERESTRKQKGAEGDGLTQAAS